MCGAELFVKLAQMSGDAPHLHVELDLEPAGDPIRGSLRDPAGNRRQFWGWLELIQALENAVAAGGGGDASGSA